MEATSKDDYIPDEFNADPVIPNTNPTIVAGSPCQSFQARYIIQTVGLLNYKYR